MADYEEETYSAVFASLKHPIRRKILRILSSGPNGFSDLQKAFEIESSHLTYHLEELGDLLLKTEDGKYALSSLGEAAVSMMNRVEEPPKAPLRLPFPRRKGKTLAVVMMAGLILLSALFLFEYERSTQLSTQYSNLNELLQKFFPEVLNLRDANLMQRYTINGTVETAYAFVKNETSGFSSWTFSGRHSVVYSVYCLTNNATLEIEILFDRPGRPQDYLDLTALRELITPVVGYVGSMVNITDLLSFNASEPFVSSAFSYQTIWMMKLTGSGKYSVLLPSRGWYFIQIQAPIEEAKSPREIGYTLTLQIQDQQAPMPFFVGSQQDYLLSSLS
jgi:DNA-binding transcriptional ArsR family regulator